MAEVKLEDLKGNSHVKKEAPKEKIERIAPEDVEVIATGKRHKKSMGRRFSEVFISDEADTVGRFIVEEVIIPGVKDALLDILHGSIDRIFGGTARGGYNSYRRRERSDREPYENYYSRGRRSRDRDDDDRDKHERRRRRRSDNFTSLEVESRSERDAVLRNMGDYIERYGHVTVAQVKRMVNIDTEPMDSDWGWSDMRDVSHYRDGDIYVIEMEPPEDLD